jgi:hypothetical protein
MSSQVDIFFIHQNHRMFSNTGKMPRKNRMKNDVCVYITYLESVDNIE